MTPFRAAALGAGGLYFFLCGMDPCVCLCCCVFIQKQACSVSFTLGCQHYWFAHANRKASAWWWLLQLCVLVPVVIIQWPLLRLNGGVSRLVTAVKHLLSPCKTPGRQIEWLPLTVCES